MLIARTSNRKEANSVERLFDRERIPYDIVNMGSYIYIDSSQPQKAKTALKMAGLVKGYGLFKNPILETLGTSLLTGAGLGAGYLGVKKFIEKKWGKNPIKGYYTCHICREKVPHAEWDAHMYHHMAAKHNPAPKGFWGGRSRDYWSGSSVEHKAEKSGKRDSEKESWADFLGVKKHQRASGGKYTYRNPKLEVSDELISYLKRIKGDRKAGHNDALDYWEGAAAGALVAENRNPKLDDYGVPVGYREYDRHYSKEEANKQAKSLREKGYKVIVLEEGYRHTMWTVFVKEGSGRPGMYGRRK